MDYLQFEGNIPPRRSNAFPTIVEKPVKWHTKKAIVAVRRRAVPPLTEMPQIK
jgi:hypothetical protein